MFIQSSPVLRSLALHSQLGHSSCISMSPAMIVQSVYTLLEILLWLWDHQSQHAWIAVRLGMGRRIVGARVVERNGKALDVRRREKKKEREEV